MSEQKNIIRNPKKFILVLGFTNRTGFSVSKLLLSLGYKHIKIADKNNSLEQQQLIEELKRNFPDAKIIYSLGNDEDPSLLEDVELVIPSPGVPRKTHKLLNIATSKNIEIIGDIELFYQLKKDVIFVGITGTDGKSTTTTLIYEILKSKYGESVKLGGNIGIPICNLFYDTKKGDIVVLELSSFQLELIKEFRPYVGVILNIAEDHLDRYENMEEYAEAKFRLFENQEKGDFAIIRSDLKDRFNNLVNKYIKSNLVLFPNDEDFIKVDEGGVILGGKEFVKQGDIKLVGVHNLENILVGGIVGRIFGMGVEEIARVVKEFRGLPHRMELVDIVKGRVFINDSKATTVQAVRRALESIKGNIIALIGGRNKGLDFSELKDLINSKVKTLIIFGEARDVIYSQLKEHIKIPVIVMDQNFKEVVKKAFEVSEEGDTILLSPGCASFDMFKNYEERGNVFKEIVKEIKNSL